MWRHEMVRVITVLSMTGVRPIRGQYPGHVISLDQSEAIIYSPADIPGRLLALLPFFLALLSAAATLAS